MERRKIAIAITGASGAIYAKQLMDSLTRLTDQLAEVTVVFSKNAPDVWRHEIGEWQPEKYPFLFVDRQNYFSPIASGSSSYDTLIICPCSMGTVGRIAHGISDDLTTRSADVMLKERRRLILVVRETPLNLIHLNNMKLLTQAGAIICPASPSFYRKPQTIEEAVQTVIDRVLDLAGFQISTYRWQEQTN